MKLSCTQPLGGEDWGEGDRGAARSPAAWERGHLARCFFLCGPEALARTDTAQGSGGGPDNVIWSTRPQRGNRQNEPLPEIFICRGEGQSKVLSRVTDRCGGTGSVPRPGRHSPCCIRGAASTAPPVCLRTGRSAQRVGAGFGSSTPRSARSAAAPLPPGSDLTGYASSASNSRPVFAPRGRGLRMAPQADRPSLSVRASSGSNMGAI